MMLRKPPKKTLLFAVLAVIAVCVAVLVVLSRSLPTKVEVERSVNLAIGAHAVFPLVNNLKNWEKWSPWMEADPEMEITYKGPEEGAGAVSEWSSKTTTSRTQVIVTSVPDRQVELAIDFGGQGMAVTMFTFEEAQTDTGTGNCKVTWKLESEMGQRPFGRFLVPAMSAEIDRAYARGLANLKRLAEGQPDM